MGRKPPSRGARPRANGKGIQKQIRLPCPKEPRFVRRGGIGFFGQQEPRAQQRRRRAALENACDIFPVNKAAARNKRYIGKGGPNAFYKLAERGWRSHLPTRFRPLNHQNVGPGFHSRFGFADAADLP